MRKLLSFFLLNKWMSVIGFYSMYREPECENEDGQRSDAFQLASHVTEVPHSCVTVTVTLCVASCFLVPL